ncbi:MAG TPA: cation diffusion facilitator family transporter, partial [Bacteroidia bacterium]|nr:cation diffusion facilitator family transporter [Bacteroidia bacterium]
VKFFTWYITRSNAILTDAFESIVNVVAGTFAMFSMMYAARPRDEDHPYGHGKIEFVSAGFEGALVFLAGGFIFYRAIVGFYNPTSIQKPEAGAYLSAAAGLCNFVMGYFLVRNGRKQNSSLMVANGKHLISDTISSAGLVAGMLLIFFTKIGWIDNALALVLAAYLLYTGYKIVREALASLLDEQDQEKIKQMIRILNEKRRPQWIDIHNLRVLKYGSVLHVDAHITLPWYMTLEESHAEVEALERLLQTEMGAEMEFFIHADPCLEFSCAICPLENCAHRKSPMQKRLDWTEKNMLPDKKHSM